MAKDCFSSLLFLFFIACSTAHNTLQVRLRHKQSVHVPKPAETGTYVTHPMYLKTRKSVHVPKTGKIGTCTERRITSANVAGGAITSANVAGDAITSANVASAPRLRRPMSPAARLRWLP